jgi:hypothetical protein
LSSRKSGISTKIITVANSTKENLARTFQTGLHERSLIAGTPDETGAQTASMEKRQYMKPISNIRRVGIVRIAHIDHAGGNRTLPKPPK